MAIRIKKDLDLNKLIPNITRNFNRAIKDTALDEIKASIESGISPVAGKGRFKQYSRLYANRFKSGFRLPVNMTQTGAMLKSLKAKGRRPGVLEVEFESDLAEIHNDDGAGKSKVIRRLLPTKTGETFRRDILRNIVNRVNRMVNTETKRQNR